VAGQDPLQLAWGYGLASAPHNRLVSRDRGLRRVIARSGHRP
jgi:hypothetical protein